MPCCFKYRLKRSAFNLCCREWGRARSPQQGPAEEEARVYLQHACVFIVKARLVGGMQDREHGRLDSSNH